MALSMAMTVVLAVVLAVVLLTMVFGRIGGIGIVRFVAAEQGVGFFRVLSRLTLRAAEVLG
jgi:hypothetical protein